MTWDDAPPEPLRVGARLVDAARQLGDLLIQLVDARHQRARALAADPDGVEDVLSLGLELGALVVEPSFCGCEFGGLPVDIPRAPQQALS